MKKVVLTIALLGMVASVFGQRVILADDMSSFPTGWTLGSNGSDNWTAKSNRWYSSGISAKCTAQDSYPNGTDVWMQRPISLAGYPMGIVSFWVWQRSEAGYDTLSFEYSTDGGVQWFAPWKRTVRQGLWRKFTISNIPAQAGLIRFRFASDASGYDEGIYLDDVVLYGMDTTGTTVFYDDMDYFPAGWNLAGDHLWGIQNYRSHSPSWAAQCAGLDSGYYNNQNSIASHSVFVRNSPFNALSFWLYIDVEEDYDRLDVQYFDVGGWNLLGRFTGFSGWTPLHYELPDGADSVRFRFVSDYADTVKGAYIDDALVSEFGVRGRDLSAVGFTNLPADADPSALVPISAVIHNFSGYGSGTPIYCQVDDGSDYFAMTAIESMPPGADVAAGFPDWTASTQPGIYPVVCSTAYFLDAGPQGDIASSYIIVASRDVGLLQIQSPTAHIPAGSNTPSVVVRNHGSTRQAASITLEIPAASYLETVSLPGGLPVRVDTVITFSAWTASTGFYTAKCSAWTSGDQIPSNNVLTLDFLAGEANWTRMTDLPTGLKSKKVKDGGALTYSGGSVSGTVYALKGAGTREFYSYDATSSLWATLESFPALNNIGKKKTVKKGATLAAVNGRIFAAKGGNTLEWWEYVPGAGWVQRADVPPSTRNVREGAGAAGLTFGGTDYIYLLKGSRTFEFYRYRVSDNTWERLANAPAGPKLKEFKIGSCLTYDGSDGIYALKGNYNEFYGYSLALNQWFTLETLPQVQPPGTRKKKAKAGAALAYANGVVHTLKGGNTREFWGYQVAASRWTTMADFPVVPGLERKMVKNGGALAYSPAAKALFGFRGNNTLDFYAYWPVGMMQDAGPSVPVAQAGSLAPKLTYSLQIAPNPFTTSSTIQYSLPRAGDISLKLYDVTGSLVSTLARGRVAAGRYNLAVSGSQLAAGVYLLKFETEEYKTTRKLILE